MALTIGIAGITGKFARSIVTKLLTHPEIKIRGYARDLTKLSPIISSSPLVYLVQGEANDVNALRSFAQGTDVVICCYLGDNNLMLNGQKHLIDACEMEGVKRYIASDYSLDYTKLELGQLPAKDPMMHVKEYLEIKNVKGVHISIGVFMETFWSQFLGVWDESKTGFMFWGTGEESWESTSYANAAEYVAKVALDEEAVGLKKFLGDRKNIRQIAELFESTYGKKPMLECLGSLDDLYKHMHKIRQENPANIFTWLPLFYQFYCLDGQTYISDNLDNHAYAGVEPITFQDFMKVHHIEELTVSQNNVGREI